MVGIMSISGLAFGMTMQLLALSGDNVFLLLLLIAVLAFVLGIGLPTVSVYILTATLLAPALVKLGVTPMAAHMFVMYNGMLSMITPPVAFAAYAAANIAATDGWTTGWIACVVGWSTFILPFLFVLTPSLLMDGPSYLIVWNFVRILFALFVGTAGIVGYALAPLSLPARLLYGFVALPIALPPESFTGGYTVNFIGIAAGIALLVFDHLRRKRRQGGARRRPRISKCPACRRGIGNSNDALTRGLLPLAPDAERFLRRPVGDREQHRLSSRVVGVFASTTAPRTRRSGPTPAPCRRPWCVPLAFDADEDGAVGRLVVLALEALREQREVRAHGRHHRAAGDRIGVAHARAVALVDVAGLHQALEDRPRPRVGVVDDRAVLDVRVRCRPAARPSRSAPANRRRRDWCSASPRRSARMNEVSKRLTVGMSSTSSHIIGFLPRCCRGRAAPSSASG